MSRTHADTALPARSCASHEADKQLKRSFIRHVLAASIVLSLLAAAMSTLPVFADDQRLRIAAILITGSLWASLSLILWRCLPHHEHAQFGAANAVTLARAAGMVLLAAWVPVASQMSTAHAWLLSLTAVLILSLDGLDGILARRTRLASNFGARFDMESDALLTLILSLLVWQSADIGVWVLFLGLARYLFLLAAVFVHELGRPLFPSFRRKLICVIQLAALCAMLSPLLPPTLDTLVGMLACSLLAASFCRDVHWLLTSRPVHADRQADRGAEMQVEVATEVDSDMHSDAGSDVNAELQVDAFDARCRDSFSGRSRRRASTTTA